MEAYSGNVGPKGRNYQVPLTTFWFWGIDIKLKEKISIKINTYVENYNNNVVYNTSD